MYNSENPPASTPWGARDYCQEMSPGMFIVGTPSHGGLAVHADSQYGTAAKEAASRSTYSFTRGAWSYLEEDCDATAFLVAQGIAH